MKYWSDIIYFHVILMSIKIGAILFIYLFFNYSIITSIFIFGLSYYTYLQFVYLLFGYRKINGVETCVFSDNPANRFNMLGFCLISNFDAPAFKDLIIEKGINLMPRLRSKITHFLFEHFWTSTSLSEAVSRVRIESPLKNLDDVYTFAVNELNKPIDIFSELPYEIYLVPYGDNNKKKGALIMKFDHILCDGLGGVSFICSLASNNEKSVYPKIMQNPRNNDTLITYIIGVLLFPYYTIKNMLLLFGPNYTHTPFRDRSQPAIKSRFALSKTFPLNTFNEMRRKYNITFNDAMVTIVSRAVKSLMDKRKIKNENNYRMKCLIPYGMKKLPLKASDVQLTIDSYAFIAYVPLITSFEESKVISHSLQSSIKNYNLILNLKWILNIICNICTYKSISIFWAMFNNQCDLGLSNIPGPSKKLEFTYKEHHMVCETIIPICTSARALPYIPLMSYNGEFRFCLTIDESIKVDEKEFISIVEKMIESVPKEEK